jgi:hypothetical protein
MAAVRRRPPARRRAKSRAKAAPGRAGPRAKARPDPRAKAKPYRLTAGELRPIAPGHGACIASDKITVDGEPVRFMYRERAIHEVDSGWRFLSGLESEAYLHDASNHAFYDCNTIANFDRTIVPLLDAPVGSAFEKPPGAAAFAPVTDWTPPEA